MQPSRAVDIEVAIDNTCPFFFFATQGFGFFEIFLKIFCRSKSDITALLRV